MSYNLRSPNLITEPVNLPDLAGWFARETLRVESGALRGILVQCGRALKDLEQWAERPLLLWQGCDRTRKYHDYPDVIRDAAKSRRITLDTRTNGPAIAAFQLAGGVRPGRFGSSNAWSTHHLYSGKFPYPGRDGTTHAAKDGRHFTQSAGLIAVHPVADALCDEFPFFAWLLRAQAFLKFGYDPDGVFSEKRDELGFSAGHGCEVFFREPGTAAAVAAGE